MSRILPLLLFLTLSTHAAQPTNYAGIGIGAGSGYEEWAYNEQYNYFLGSTYDNLYDYSFDATLTDFKLGFDYDYFRLELSLAKIEITGTESNTTHDKSVSGIDFDYVLPFMRDNENFFPFIAVGLGQYSGGGLGSGFAFNLNFGLFYTMTEKVEMEFAYKLKSIQWGTITTSDGDALDITEQISYGYVGLKFEL